MMPIAIHIEQRGMFPFAPKSIQNQIMTSVHYEIAKEWHEKFKGLHFGDQAKTRYGYGNRTREYMRRKLKPPPTGVGHQRPLEWSGDSRRLAMGNKGNRPTRDRAKAIINAPTFNRLSPKVSYINMRKEMTKVLPEENDHLLKVAAAKFAALQFTIPLEKVIIG